MSHVTMHGRIHRAGGPDPGATKWIYVGEAGAPAFEGAWDNVGSPWAPVRFRLNGDGDLEIDGAATGGTSGTVVFYLPAAFWPPHSSRRTSALTLDDALAITEVDSTDGAVTVYEIA